MKRNLTLLIAVMTMIALLAGCSSSEALNSVGTSVDGNEVKIEAAAMKTRKWCCKWWLQASKF